MTDKIGSVRGLVKKDGTWQWGTQYTPYGVVFEHDSVSGATARLPIGWTGARYDVETGFYFLRNRYYDPAAGRFTQEDPMGYQGGGNVYAYGGGSPLSGRDPGGTRMNDEMYAGCTNCHDLHSGLDDDVPYWDLTSSSWSVGMGGDAGVPSRSSTFTYNSAMQEVDVHASDGEIVEMFLSDDAGYNDDDATENELASIAADATLSVGDDQFFVTAFTGGDHGAGSAHGEGGAIDIGAIGDVTVRSMNCSAGGQFELAFFMLAAATDRRMGPGAQVIGPLGGVTIGSGGQWHGLNMNSPVYNAAGARIPGTLGTQHSGHVHIGLW